MDSLVRGGIVVNNLLPFGAKKSEIFGKKNFVAKDRMDWRKPNYHFDV
ncbi:MAG: hypothetical protein QW260_02605 [Thermoproteota archaeon]